MGKSVKLIENEGHKYDNCRWVISQLLARSPAMSKALIIPWLSRYIDAKFWVSSEKLCAAWR